MSSTADTAAAESSAGPSVLARLVLAVVIAGLVTGVVGSWLITRSAGRALRSEIDRQNEGLSSNLARRLDDRILNRAATLHTVATRRNIEAVGPAAQSELNVVLKVLPDISTLMVFDRAGEPVAAASGTRLIDVASVGARAQLVQSLEPGSFQAVLVGARPSLVDIAVPIENPPGTVSGALVAELPLEDLASHLQEVQVGTTRRAFLVREDGRLLVHPESDRVLAEETFPLPPAGERPAVAFSGRDTDNVSYLFAAARTENVPAAVVLQQQESEALAAVSTSTRNLALILLVVMVVTVLTVGVLGRWLLAPLRSMATAARRIGRGEQGARVPVTGYGEVGRLGEELNRMAEALELRMAELEERKAQEAKLREQRLLAETLYNVGRVLTSQLDLKEVVQAVTDIATELTGAQFGAFFYNVADTGDESYMLYTLAGVPHEAFSQFPMPRNTEVFGPTFRGERTVRSDDITEDPAYGHNEPFFGMPEGHLPVRSYLAVPVVTRNGEVLGGLFFGHERVGVFSERHEQLAEGIAGQAVIAIENARLYAAQRSAAETLQRSLLPSMLPRLGSLRAAARYLPAVPGVEVGGDWYDLIALPDGRVAVVVGDVVGRGTVAAGTMGQLCHALRAYALEDPSPAQMLGRLNQFLLRMGTDEQIATVVVAVLDPSDGTLCIANAGHPPPLRCGQGFADFLEVESGPPVGALPDTAYKEESHLLPADERLLLYTDGLVEDRRMPLGEGLERLRTAALDCRASDIDGFCDYVLGHLAEGRDVQDDIAILAIGPAGE